jgi:hypothetical protein
VSVREFRRLGFVAATWEQLPNQSAGMLVSRIICRRT